MEGMRQAPHKTTRAQTSSRPWKGALADLVCTQHIHRFTFHLIRIYLIMAVEGVPQAKEVARLVNNICTQHHTRIHKQHRSCGKCATGQGSGPSRAQNTTHIRTLLFLLSYSCTNLIITVEGVPQAKAVTCLVHRASHAYVHPYFYFLIYDEPHHNRGRCATGQGSGPSRE